MTEGALDDHQLLTLGLGPIAFPQPYQKRTLNTFRIPHPATQ